MRALVGPAAACVAGIVGDPPASQRLDQPEVAAGALQGRRPKRCQLLLDAVDHFGRLKRSHGTHNVSIARIALKRGSRGATPRAPLAWGDAPVHRTAG